MTRAASLMRAEHTAPLLCCRVIYHKSAALFFWPPAELSGKYLDFDFQLSSKWAISCRGAIKRRFPFLTRFRLTSACRAQDMHTSFIESFQISLASGGAAGFAMRGSRHLERYFEFHGQGFFQSDAPVLHTTGFTRSSQDVLPASRLRLQVFIAGRRKAVISRCRRQASDSSRHYRDFARASCLMAPQFLLMPRAYYILRAPLEVLSWMYEKG